jgi:glycosyltransferase involved in cell wall biosynthesis
MMPAREHPRVSVAMITFNHAAYIAQAIESVIMQRSDFPIELVVGDDCSTDTTRQIVQHYARLRPDIVRPLFHEKNVGMHANFRSVRLACRAEYIACLEGDDFWTDPEKLKTQVEILDTHPQAALTFHPARGIDASGAPLGWNWPASPPAQEFSRVVEVAEAILTATVMFRARLANDMEFDRVSKYPVGDYPLYFSCCREGGLVHYLDRCMASYRRHANGITATLGAGGSFHQRMAKMWQDLATQSQLLRDPSMRRRLWNLYYSASRHFADEGKTLSAFSALIDSFPFADLPFGQMSRDYVKSFVRIAWLAFPFNQRSRRKAA